MASLPLSSALGHSTPKPTSRSARKAATRTAILDAAVRCFSQSGIETCTMEEIAQAAGVSKGLVHYHFDTKERLLSECERWLVGSLFLRVHAVANLKVHTPEAALAILDQVWHEINESSIVPLLLHLSLRALSGQPSPSFSGLIDEHRSVLHEGVKLVLGPMTEQLTIEVEVFTELLLVALVGLQIDHIIGGSRERIDKVYAVFRQMLPLLLATPAGASGRA